MISDGDASKGYALGACTDFLGAFLSLGLAADFPLEAGLAAVDEDRNERGRQRDELSEGRRVGVYARLRAWG